MQAPEVTFPGLSPPHHVALDAALAYIFEHFEPFAVLLSGSVAAGNADASSDLDLNVLHRQPWRQRVQRRFAGVPTEIFINSPQWITTCLAQEVASGQLVLCHMLATGRVLFSSSEQTAELIEAARALLAAGPRFSDAALEHMRYSAACLFEDAFAAAAHDEATAALILNQAAEATFSFWFASRQRFSVRAKDRLATIRATSPAIAALLEQVLLVSGVSTRIFAGRQLAQLVLGHTGFFEWDSGHSQESRS